MFVKLLRSYWTVRESPGPRDSRLALSPRHATGSTPTPAVSLEDRSHPYWGGDDEGLPVIQVVSNEILGDCGLRDRRYALNIGPGEGCRALFEEGHLDGLGAIHGLPWILDGDELSPGPSGGRDMKRIEGMETVGRCLT